MAPQPSMGQLHMREASLSRSDTQHSVGLLWTNDQHVGQTSARQHTSQSTIRAPSGIRTHKPSKRAAAGPCLRPRGLRGSSGIVNVLHLINCVKRLFVKVQQIKKRILCTDNVHLITSDYGPGIESRCGVRFSLPVQSGPWGPFTFV
jgi:hypothetical protein